MKLRKIISSVLTVLILSASIFTVGTTAADGEMPFRDVGKKKWYYDEIKFVYEKGLMNGITKTTFEPESNLTRGMFITVLGRLANAEQTTTNRFSDVKKKDWYSGYVGWAVDAGIVIGYSDGTFLPEKELTREEMAACISRYVDYMDINLPRESSAPSVFADAKKIGKWAREYVEVLRRSGIAKGDQYENTSDICRILSARLPHKRVSHTELTE